MKLVATVAGLFLMTLLPAHAETKVCWLKAPSAYSPIDKLAAKAAAEQCQPGDTLYSLPAPSALELGFLCDLDKPVVIISGGLVCRYPGPMTQR